MLIHPQERSRRRGRPHRRVLLGAAAIAVVFLVGGVGAVPANASTAGPALKPAGAGLYVRDNITPDMQPTIDHVFLDIPWADLEPANGSFTGPGWDAINTALANPRVHGIRLRISAGTDAPSWLNDVSGQCLQLTNDRNKTGCVPRYWTDAYLGQYQQLMTEVARRYDANPKVLDVVNAACQTFTAEPFIKNTGDPDYLPGQTAQGGGPNREYADPIGAALFDAGDNYAGELHCMTVSMADQMAAFVHTRTSIGGHVVWQEPVSGGLRTSWPDERNLLQQWRSEYGPKLVVQDNGLSPAKATCDQSAPTPSNADGLWCYIKAIDPPKGAQMGCGPNPPLPCDQTLVIQTGLQYGACFIEHRNWNELSTADAARYDQQLKHNCNGFRAATRST